jgi:hypothetical protein
LFIVLLASFSLFFPYLSYRERRDPKSNSSEKKSRHSSPVSKRIGSSAKFHHKDGFYPERAASHVASEYNHDSNKWSKKGQDIKW